MKPKAWILPIFLVATLGAIHFLPEVGQMADSAVDMRLPQSLLTWQFQDLAPSAEELGTLSTDTQFSKAMCFSPRPGEYRGLGYRVPDRVDLSIVLSGADLNNSIHRPERCMPAQGHNIISSSDRLLKLDNGRQFECKRLVSVQSSPVAVEGGKERYEKHDCLTYYFFVGHDRVTNSHLERTLFDMKDRLLKGMDQHWAYISVSMWYGKVPWIDKNVGMEEADEKLQKFLAEFAERQIRWDLIQG